MRDSTGRFSQSRLLIRAGVSTIRFLMKNRCADFCSLFLFFESFYSDLNKISLSVIPRRHHGFLILENPLAHRKLHCHCETYSTVGFSTFGLGTRLAKDKIILDINFTFFKFNRIQSKKFEE